MPLLVFERVPSKKIDTLHGRKYDFFMEKVWKYMDVDGMKRINADVYYAVYVRSSEPMVVVLHQIDGEQLV